MVYMGRFVGAGPPLFYCPYLKTRLNCTDYEGAWGCCGVCTDRRDLMQPYPPPPECAITFHGVYERVLFCGNFRTARLSLLHAISYNDTIILLEYYNILPTSPDPIGPPVVTIVTRRLNVFRFAHVQWKSPASWVATAWTTVPCSTTVPPSCSGAVRSRRTTRPTTT